MTANLQRDRRTRFGLSAVVAVGYLIATRVSRIAETARSYSSDPCATRASSERSTGMNSSEKGRISPKACTL